MPELLEPEDDMPTECWCLWWKGHKEYKEHPECPTHKPLVSASVEVAGTKLDVKVKKP